MGGHGRRRIRGGQRRAGTQGGVEERVGCRRGVIGHQQAQDGQRAAVEGERAGTGPGAHVEHAHVGDGAAVDGQHVAGAKPAANGDVLTAASPRDSVIHNRQHVVGRTAANDAGGVTGIVLIAER